MAECQNPHPEGFAVCEIKAANHPMCTGRAESGFVDWANPSYAPPSRGRSRGQASEELRTMASRVGKATRAASTAPAPLEGFSAGLAGSEQAAQRWDDEQKAHVDDAILMVAHRHAGGREFTSDAIWEELAGRVPVTKGLTGRLTKAENEGWIANTGQTTISERGGEHDHGQRLTLWCSLF